MSGDIIADMDRRTFLSAGLSAGLTAGGAAALAGQTPYAPSDSNLKARQWFQDAKFGLFVHWGVYSVLGRGEWAMHNAKMTIAEYEKLAPEFNPIRYDPVQWVALAKAAGMRYITITSKHHDGFAMWRTRQSRWNIVDRTPYRKDVLRPLADACRKQDVRLFFYHSHLDWHHPDYYPRGRTGQHSGRPEGGAFDRYLDYMDRQLRELLTDYGDVAGIWFDGIWDRKDADWRLRRTYDMIHEIQPACLVGNNHHLAPFDGEDFQMFERDLPGQNTAGFSGEAKIGKLPLETCDTMNGSWGYNENDRKFKSARQLIHYLVRAAGNNANFLLNVGPKPDGTIQDEFVSTLQEMGAWLSKYGESIYGTRSGPIPPRSWGATTAKGDRVYVHVLDWQDPVLAIPSIRSFRRANFLGSGRAAELVNVNDATLLMLPPDARDPIDTVIVLEV
jgi:alpha-L-fucosidase